MKNKNFLKIKKTGEERYFVDLSEFEKFRDKFNGVISDEFLNEFIKKGKRALHIFFSLCNRKHNHITVINGFLIRVFHGNYGKYNICIVAEQYVYNQIIDYNIFEDGI